MADRIIQARPRIGTVGPQSIASSAGIRRGAALIAEGGRAMQEAGDQWANTFGKIFEENQANSESIYIEKTLADERETIARKNDKYASDPDFFKDEAKARYDMMTSNAKEHLRPRALAMLEAQMTRLHGQSMVGFIGKKNTMAKNEAYATYFDAFKSFEQFYGDQAATQGMNGMGDFLENMDLFWESNLLQAQEGGLGEMTFSNGDTAFIRLQRERQRVKAAVVAAGLGKEAKEALTEHGYDPAQKFVLSFIEKGLPGLELNHDERRTIGNLAMAELQATYASNAAERKTDQITMAPQYTDLANALKRGEAGRDDIIKVVEKNKKTISIGQVYALYSAASEYENEMITQEEANTVIEQGQVIKENFERWSGEKIVKWARANKISSGGTKTLLLARMTAKLDRDKITEGRKIQEYKTALKNSVKAPNYAEIEQWAVENSISGSRVSELYSAAAAKWQSNLTADDQAFIQEKLQEIRSNPLAFNYVSARQLLASRGLENDPQAVAQVTATYAQSWNKFLTKNRNIQDAARKAAAGVLTPQSDGAQDFLAQIEDKAGVDFTAMEPEQVNDMRQMFRAIYGNTGVLSDRVKEYLGSGMSDVQNVEAMNTRIAVYSDLRAIDGKPFLIDQLPDRVRSFYDHIIDQGIQMGEEVPDAVRSVIDYMTKPKNERELTVARWIGEDEPDVREWIGDRLESDMEWSKGFMAVMMEALPLIDQVPSVSPQMVADAEIMMTRLMHTYKDPEVAMKVVARRMTGLYSPSRYSRNGSNTWMRSSPEAFYRDAMGSTHYIRWQVAAEMKNLFSKSMPGDPLGHDRWVDNYGTPGENNSWWLEPTRDSALNPSRSPIYNIHYVDDDGVRKVVGGALQPYQFQPKPSQSHDVIREEDIARKLNQQMRDNPQLKRAIEAAPFGAAMEVAEQKRKLDLIEYIERSGPARAIRWLGRQF